MRFVRAVRCKYDNSRVYSASPRCVAVLQNKQRLLQRTLHTLQRTILGQRASVYIRPKSQRMYCIETKKLTYRFPNGETVLHSINLQVPEGSVYGFLGPNGAGKTTTLRLILGLLRRQQGEIELFGKPFEKNRVALLKNTGSLIESPSLYGHLSATENLRVWQKLYQCPDTRIGEVLEIVGLAGTGKKRASRFSLGMKQRLSIAVALLHDPALLILDEPTNGLDPNGIIEVRELLKQLNREHGKTIVVSSHLLSEIEKMVTHLGIIHKGALLFQGTLDELQLQQTLSSSIRFETSDAGKTAAVLVAQGWVASSSGGQVSIPLVEKENVAKVIAQLVREGVDVYQVAQTKNDLESIFIDLVKK